MNTSSLRRAAILLLLFALLAAGVSALQKVDKPSLVSTEGRSFEKAVVVQILRDNLQENGARIGDQIVRLQLSSGSRQGEYVEANSPNGLLFGTVCQPGMQVITIASRSGSQQIYTVYSLDRFWPIAGFIGAFLLLLCLIGGSKGIKSAIALLLTFACFLLLFFPLLLHGMAPITDAVLVSFLVLCAAIWLIQGTTWSALTAILASCLGVFTAGTAAMLFGHAAGLSGWNVANIEALLFIAQSTPIDVGQLLFAGILFSSLGAVMDIAMDITAAGAELCRRQPDIPPYELFESCLHVGRDVMGTMSATLILAFFGGSLGLWVLDYVYDLPTLQLMNSNTIGIGLMQGLSGSFGIILTVPAAALLCARLPHGGKQRAK